MRARDEGAKIRAVFKRLQTDEEFRERLRGKPLIKWSSGLPSYYSGEGLDSWAWEYYGLQRQIIEATA